MSRAPSPPSPSPPSPPFLEAAVPSAVPASPGHDSLASTLGQGTLELLQAGKELSSLFVRTLYYTARGRREPGAVVQQMYAIGNRSLVFLTVVMGFIGMILVYQAGLQNLRVLPELSMLGANFLELLVRDFAASIGALMLATRVGAGIAAELGSMVVTEQVDALRMCAADPVDYLVKPRFLASLVMTTALLIWGAGVAFATGLLTAHWMFDLSPRTFADTRLIDAGDLTIGLTKCLAYGAAIPIIASHAGLSAYGGSEGVGSATTRAVVSSCLAVIVLNLVISVAGHLVFG